jgi:hypothetical protein
VLLTSRPFGVRHVRVRLRVGVIVDLHVRGPIVRRLDPRALTVQHSGALRLLELRLVNRGNVTEQLAGDGLRVALLRDRRKFTTLRPQSRELLPHSVGIAVFAYQGRLRGSVVARVELRAPVRGRRAHFTSGYDR